MRERRLRHFQFFPKRGYVRHDDLRFARACTSAFGVFKRLAKTFDQVLSHRDPAMVKWLGERKSLTGRRLSARERSFRR